MQKELNEELLQINKQIKENQDNLDEIKLMEEVDVKTKENLTENAKEILNKLTAQKQEIENKLTSIENSDTNDSKDLGEIPNNNHVDRKTEIEMLVKSINSQTDYQNAKQAISYDEIDFFEKCVAFYKSEYITNKKVKNKQPIDLKVKLWWKILVFLLLIDILLYITLILFGNYMLYIFIGLINIVMPILFIGAVVVTLISYFRNN